MSDDEVGPDDRATGEESDDDSDAAVGRADQAAYAQNWRTVLAVDAGVGVVIAVIGGVVLVTGRVVVGALLAALGVVYVALVGRRYAKWKAIRAAAGLP
ncbi:MAG TPA: hypothetical protein VHN98_05595 [Acidimicrobiales bacterium]|nr:hypothetical protein [Acidimicrobiales bacterium]